MAYHIDSNTILVRPFHSRHDRLLLAAYNRIMYCIKINDHTVDLKILDNESSETHKLAIEENWGCKFQIFLPNFHHCNAAERAILTIKAHFLTILNSVLSRKGTKFVTFYIKNFYLQTPLDLPEYVRIKMSDIPHDSIKEYNLKYYVHVNSLFNLKSVMAFTDYRNQES